MDVTRVIEVSLSIVGFDFRVISADKDAGRLWFDLIEHSVRSHATAIATIFVPYGVGEQAVADWWADRHAFHAEQLAREWGGGYNTWFCRQPPVIVCDPGEAPIDAARRIGLAVDTWATMATPPRIELDELKRWAAELGAEQVGELPNVICCRLGEWRGVMPASEDLTDFHDAAEQFVRQVRRQLSREASNDR